MAPRTRASASPTPAETTSAQPLELQLMDDRPPAAQPLAIGLPVNPTPAQMLMVAIERGTAVQDLGALLDLRDRWEKGEAKKAYTAAMARFKATPPTIIKDRRVGYENKDGSFTGYSHASLAEVVGKIAAGLGAVGISHSWDVKHDAGKIVVTCILTHELGHSESVTLPPAAPDASGQKNPIQQMGSTITYLQRYSLLSITGLAAKDQDDDGQGHGDGATTITPEQVNELREMFKAYNVDEGKFLAYGKIKSLEEIRAVNFEAAKGDIIAKKGPQRRSQQAAQSAGAAQASHAVRISTEQLRAFAQKMDRAGVSERAVLTRYNLDSLDRMTVEELGRAEEWLAAMHP